MLQEKFSVEHGVLLPNLIAPEIVELLLDLIRESQFEVRNYGGVTRELWLPRSTAGETLDFLLNNPVFLDSVRQITGVAVNSFPAGRIYRFAPGEGHYVDWHNDIHATEKRLLAISINLSPTPFEGGELVIREAKTNKVVFEYANSGLGDAVIFQVDRSLEHRVSPLRGNNARTAFAGWFFDKVNLHTAVRASSASELYAGSEDAH